MEAEVVLSQTLPKGCNLIVEGKAVAWHENAELKTLMPPAIESELTAPTYRPDVPPLYALYLDGKVYLYARGFILHQDTLGLFHVEFSSEHILHV